MTVFAALLHSIVLGPGRRTYRLSYFWSPAAAIWLQSNQLGEFSRDVRHRPLGSAQATA